MPHASGRPVCQIRPTKQPRPRRSMSLNEKLCVVRRTGVQQVSTTQRTYRSHSPGRVSTTRRRRQKAASGDDWAAPATRVSVASQHHAVESEIQACCGNSRAPCTAHQAVHQKGKYSTNCTTRTRVTCRVSTPGTRDARSAVHIMTLIMCACSLSSSTHGGLE